MFVLSSLKIMAQSNILCFIFALSMALLQIGCISFRPPEARNSKFQVGTASWYGKKFHGRKTASGEVYNMYKLTAAHRYAPLGSFAIVKNLKNGRQVKVRINDRGPFVKGRIIDLSYAAAKRISMTATGTAKVRVSFLSDYNPVSELNLARYYIQVAAFEDRDNAILLKNKLIRNYKDTFIFKVHLKNNPTYRICIGPAISEKSFDKILGELQNEGYLPLVTTSHCIR